MIRPATKGDLNAIMEIWLTTNISTHHYVPGAYWESQVPAVREAISQADILVAVAENEPGADEIQGFIGMVDDYLAGLFVKADAQGKGYGHALLKAVQTGHDSVSLHVYLKNERAVKFYEKHGFIATDDRIDPATGEEECRMVWKKG